jgi:hypothetical protein
MKGSFPGQVKTRLWTLSILGTHAPTEVSATGMRLSPHAYHWDSTSKVLTITLPRHSVHAPITVTYR